jgi:hypothetical protein
MNYRDRLSTTQGKETVGSCLEPGHTMVWLLDVSTSSYYQEMAAEERPTLSGLFDRAERLYDKKTLPHPTRSPITALRTFFGIATLVGSCTVPVTSLLFAAELFPYSPPSSSQQRSVERQPAERLQLSSEDRAEVGHSITSGVSAKPSLPRTYAKP